MNCFIHSKALSNFTPNPSRHFWPHCAKTVPNTFTESWLCQNPGHLIGLAVHFLQSLSLHLQFHLRILLEDLCVTLSKELCNPLVGDTACTEPRRIGGAQVIDPEVGNSRAFQCLPRRQYRSESWSRVSRQWQVLSISLARKNRALAAEQVIESSEASSCIDLSWNCLSSTTVLRFCGKDRIASLRSLRSSFSASNASGVGAGSSIRESSGASSVSGRKEFLRFLSCISEELIAIRVAQVKKLERSSNAERFRNAFSNASCTASCASSSLRTMCRAIRSRHGSKRLQSSPKAAGSPARAHARSSFSAKDCGWAQGRN